MESILQMLGPLVIVILISLLSNSRRRRTEQQQRPEGVENENAAIPNEDGPPTFIEGFPYEMVFEEDIAETPPVEETEAVEAAAPEPVAETPPEPPPVPVDSPTGRRSLPTTSLLNLSPQTFRQGIILSEILGPPKSRRARR